MQTPEGCLKTNQPAGASDTKARGAGDTKAREAGDSVSMLWAVARFAGSFLSEY